MQLPHSFEPGTKVDLDSIETNRVDGNESKKSAEKQLEKNAEVIADLSRRMYAENKRSILLVLQGMDTAGKDGTIRNTMRGINPRNCQVISFKKPSEVELDHDFLWRVHRSTPRKGNIAIFNRSHYEDVLIVRVHNLVPTNVWSERYELINDFEKLLSHGGTTVIKCFLHISHEEQRERLQERVDIPEKRWKFNRADLDERKLWNDYQKAYTAVLEKCNTDVAPWYIVPSDRKWYRNLLVSNLLRTKMEQMNPEFPEVQEDFSGIVVE